MLCDIVNNRCVCIESKVFVDVEACLVHQAVLGGMSDHRCTLILFTTQIVK